jgi:hypothetical protein
MTRPFALTRRPTSLLAAVVLLWLLFAQTVRGAVISSLASDEGPHLAVGYSTLRTGDLRLQPIHIHPPLINVLAGAPLLLDPSLPDPRSIPGWEIASLSAVTDTVIWKHTPPDGIALAGRLPIILLAALLGAFVYRWATDVAGWKAGLLALFLYVLDPNIVAHAQVITTDMGVTAFGFIALYCCYKSVNQQIGPSLKWTVGTGAALGAALASKVSAALLAPLLVVIVLLAGRGRIVQRAWRVVIIALIAFGVVWAVYGFQVGRVPGLSVLMPLATHMQVYQSLQQHYDEGHPAFLMGMNSTRGWWYYFLVAFLVKTPLPTLVLLVAALAVSLRPPVKSVRWSAAGGQWSAIGTLGLFPVAHFATALFSSVDIGYRHLLPILPFLFVFIAVSIARRRSQDAECKTQNVRRKLFTVPACACLLISVLLAWYAIGAVRIWPHNLAYFNELAGGPDGGYRWLVDSNLDWGQNLKELKAWLDARGIQHVYVSQFSPSRPEVYGLQATMLPPSPRAAPFVRLDPAPGWYAIGATTLQGVYTSDVNTLAWFRSHEPAARLGHALFIYEVLPRPSPTWAAVCTDPAPLLSPEETREAFDCSDLRVITINCRQSWVYPAGSGEGGYVMPLDAEPPPGATLEARARYPDGRPFYTVYRAGQAAAFGGRAATSKSSVDGPLVFMNYRADQMSVYPGESVEVWTFWRVKEIPNRPLSLMAHLVKLDGTPIAVGDGIGMPIEQWQPGDIIVQRHRLQVSKETLPGRYWIQAGAYWLDTLERWPARDENGQASDRLMLTWVEVLD